MSWLADIATTATNAFDPTSLVSTNVFDPASLVAPILSTGLVGVVLVMLIFEIGLVTKKSLERALASFQAELALKDEVIKGKDADLADLKVVNADLQRLTSEKMIPALVQATEVSRAYVSELAKRGTLGPNP